MQTCECEPVQLDTEGSSLNMILGKNSTNAVSLTGLVSSMKNTT